MAVYGCMWLNIGIYGSILMYRAISGCIAAAAAATRLRIQPLQTLLFRPQVASDLTRRWAGGMGILYFRLATLY